MTHHFHRFYSVALSVLLVGGLAAPLALAKDGATAASSDRPAKTCRHDKMSGKHKEAHQKFMQELNLTEQQKEQLKAAHEQFRKENAAAIDSMKAKRQQLKELGKEPANDAQRQKLKAQLQQERKALMAKKHELTQGILTPEQQAKWDAKKAERKAKWEQHHKNKTKSPGNQ